MTTFSLHIELSQVADLDAKHVARTWFFLILKPLKEVSEVLVGLLQPEYRVKYLCFAEEQTLQNQPVTIGYLEFIHNRGLSGIKSYPGLDMAILGQRKIDVLKPDQCVSFIRGNFQMKVREYKPANQDFWASHEQRVRKRGRKMKVKVEVEEELKEVKGKSSLEVLSRLFTMKPGRVGWVA